MAPIRILLVEDERAHAVLIRKGFRAAGDRYELTVVSCLKDAFEQLETFSPDLVIVDWLLPDGRGIDLLPKDKRSLQFPVVVMTAHGSQELAVEAMKAGALDYVVKSDMTLADMTHTAERALREWGLITARKEAEQALRESEEKLRLITDALPVLISYVDSEQRFQFGNRTHEEWLRKPLKEIHGKRVEEVFGDDAYAKTKPHIEAALAGRFVEYEDTLTLGDDHPRDVSGVYVPHAGRHGEVKGFAALVSDITGLKTVERRLEASLREKDVLLREIHHRVKNNLQVMSSLLGLQSEHVKDESHLRMFRDAEDRVRSMALVHEMLYQSENLADLDIRQYVLNLVNYLMGAYGTAGRGAVVKTDIGEVALSVDAAISLGFIITELFSNCLKHAFPDARAGEITISLKPTFDSECELVVADNGVGLGDSVDPFNPKSLGLDLVNTFVDQLGGKMRAFTEERTEFHITFHDVRKHRQG